MCTEDNCIFAVSVVVCEGLKQNRANYQYHTCISIPDLLYMYSWQNDQTLNEFILIQTAGDSLCQWFIIFGAMVISEQKPLF